MSDMKERKTLADVIESNTYPVMYDLLLHKSDRELIIAALRAQPATPTAGGDASCSVLIEALRNCGCPSDRRGTVGKCQDAGTCGCSLPSTSLKTAQGE